jgi:hypothetical protein
MTTSKMSNRTSSDTGDVTDQPRPGDDAVAASPARRKLIAASASSAVATAALASGWIRPVIHPTVLPAHAQTTPVNTVRWAYDNTGLVDPPQPSNSLAFGTGPCGNVQGYVLVNPG